MVKWNDEFDPIADLKAMRDSMLKDNFCENQKQFYKFLYKQLIIGYFNFFPNSTIEECLKATGIEKSIAIKIIEELLERKILIISRSNKIYGSYGMKMQEKNMKLK